MFYAIMGFRQFVDAKANRTWKRKCFLLAFFRDEGSYRNRFISQLAYSEKGPFAITTIRRGL